jgi:hypothetical protein
VGKGETGCAGCKVARLQGYTGFKVSRLESRARTKGKAKAKAKKATDPHLLTAADMMG